MKTIWILSVIWFLAACSATQKEARKLRKEQKEIASQLRFDSISKVTESRRFVLEADFISNESGRKVHVSSNLNFIRVDSAAIVMQIGSNSGIGYNGVGGVTAEGTIGRWNLTKNDRKKVLNIQMNVMSNLGIYDVFLTIGSNGSANAMVTGLHYGKLVYDGNIVPLEDARVFKGRSY